MRSTCLVTGANRGLGLEFVSQLQASGERVIATTRQPQRARNLADLRVEVWPLDVSDEASVIDLGRRLADTRIDVLINNAGIGVHERPLEKLDTAEMARFFEVNCVGALRVTRALLSNLRAGRRKVVANVTSLMGSIQDNRSGGYYAYRTSKAALNMATRSLAIDLRAEGFICVALHPGWVRTDMGGAGAPLSPAESVRGMLQVIGKLSRDDTGRYLDYQGRELPW